MGNSQVFKEGLRVLNVQEGSPFSKSDLQPFDDYIVEVLDTAPGFLLRRDFAKYVFLHEGKSIQLLVYSILRRRTRKVEVTPSRDWGPASNLLGIKYRREKIHGDNILRVTRVTKDGPTWNSGIKEPTYFIIGVMQFSFENSLEFGRQVALLHQKETNPYIDCYTLNINNMERKLIRIYPSNKWGGEGLLGIELASGIFDTAMLENALLLQTASYDNNYEEDHIFNSIENQKLEQVTVIHYEESTQDLSEPDIEDDSIKVNEISKSSISDPTDIAYFSTQDFRGNIYKIQCSSLLPSLEFEQRFETFAFNK